MHDHLNKTSFDEKDFKNTLNNFKEFGLDHLQEPSLDHISVPAPIEKKKQQQP